MSNCSNRQQARTDWILISNKMYVVFITSRPGVVVVVDEKKNYLKLWQLAVDWYDWDLGGGLSILGSEKEEMWSGKWWHYRWEVIWDNSSRHGNTQTTDRRHLLLAEMVGLRPRGQTSHTPDWSALEFLPKYLIEDIWLISLRGKPSAFTHSSH